MQLFLEIAAAAAAPPPAVAANPGTVPASDVLVTLLLCGLVGLMGQGVRAIVGLKNLKQISDSPSQQSIFNVAYLIFSLMIGFIAGIVAGFVTGLAKLQTFDLNDTKMLLAIAVSGYAGADFIENSFSLIIPNTGERQPSGVQSGGGAATLHAALQAGRHLAVFTPSVTRGDEHIATDGSAFLASALRIVAPKINLDKWLSALQKSFEKFDISSDRRIAAAIGQYLVEAGSAFQEVVENLNYTSEERIFEVFKDHFADVDAAKPFVKNPEALANRVYANRLGNGDEASGDGFRFRGRGLIQLTGRSEYREFGSTIGKSPEQASAYLETAEGAAMSGAWYLSAKNCLPLADSWQLSKITLIVNGKAMEGNSQRLAYSHGMLKALGSAEASVA